MKLDRYIDTEKLHKHISEGYVDVKYHPNLPLALYCHTRKATFDNVWDEVTTKCRGLIVESTTGELVARPFEKFFNVEATLLADVEACERPVFSEKLDGSLGTFWKYKGHWGIASKGSFTSPHANWATHWMANHIEDHGQLIWPIGYTPVFEMVAESVQTHVLNYEGKEDLVLLALIHNDTGEELWPSMLLDYAQRNHITPVQFYNLTLGAAIKLDRQNREGFVATYPRPGQPPLKMKIKHPTFLRNQKLVHQVSPKHLLELLGAGDVDSLGDLAELLPPHIFGKVESWREQYTAEYKHIHAHAAILVHEILRNMTTRKEAAEFLVQPDNKPYAGICFALLDQDERYKRTIWKLVGQRVQITNTIDGGE